MSFERRDFIKTGAAGLTACFLNQELAHAQAAKGELEGGTSSVWLEGKLKSGVVKIEARDFIDDRDRSLIIHAQLDSTDLYNAMFSYDHDRTVYAVFRDHGHSTAIALSSTDDPKIATMVVWNDGGAPDSFRVDKEKFMDTKKLEASILDDGGKRLDVIGKRKPPSFTAEELEEVFGKNPALQEFMRGRRSTHHPMASERLGASFCDILRAILGSFLTLAWEA